MAARTKAAAMLTKALALAGARIMNGDGRPEACLYAIARLQTSGATAATLKRIENQLRRAHGLRPLKTAIAEVR